MTKRGAEQAQYANGYQQALADIATQLKRGGESAVREWIENNLAAPKCPTCRGALIWCEDNWACLECGNEWSIEQITGE